MNVWRRVNNHVDQRSLNTGSSVGFPLPNSGTTPWFSGEDPMSSSPCGQHGGAIGIEGPSAVNKEEPRKRAIYSRKLLIGGLPWLSTRLIRDSFIRFGKMDIDWARNRKTPNAYAGSNFWCFLIFRREESIHLLLQSCLRDCGDGFYMSISPQKEPVRIQPWALADFETIRETAKINPLFSVFVGGVPVPMKSSELAEHLRGMFGVVDHVVIFTDRLRYPIGSAKVTFAKHNSAVTAIQYRTVNSVYKGHTSKLEIRPFIHRMPRDRK